MTDTLLPTFTKGDEVGIIGQSGYYTFQRWNKDGSACLWGGPGKDPHGYWQFRQIPRDQIKHKPFPASLRRDIEAKRSGRNAK